ncbi:MAG: ABC-F type ribosomal protection protein [Defluviitaleaceae bacterium]|nr:ABC-F type ribosomal protection protein [Defluviitaleaceae bacterium]
MALINITNLTFAYEGSYDNIFENVSFQIDTDWKLGFTGRNGRGKTTFLNLLMGKFPYGGTISIPCKFEYFPFEISDESLSTISIVKNIYPSYQKWELERELSLLEVESEVLYRPFYTLSNGERTKIMLAALFLKENSFLLIDEPTNHLDSQGREIVSKYLKGKKGYILVSHDRAFLDGCISHILSINKVDIEIQRGNFSSWLLNKERQDSSQLAQNDKLKKEIKRLEKTAREKAMWSDKAESRKIGFNPKNIEKSIGRRPYEAAKSAKMMKRSKVIQGRYESASEEKSKLLKNIESSESLKLAQLDYHHNRLISLKDVSIFYGDKIVCENINLTIEKSERISLCGKNGSGKSSIIKLVCGEGLQYTGNFEKSSGLSISYISQDTSYLKGGLSAFIRENGLDETLFKAILRKLDFSRVQFDKKLEDFSAGQKKKVLIARSLCEKSHILIWDEPLNYIDVISRMQIENLLAEYQPTILFVEHDSVFCNKIATRNVYL